MTTFAALDRAPLFVQVSASLPALPVLPVLPDGPVASSPPITDRDRAVLRAVADGRCDFAGSTLTIDSVRCCDQFVGARLAGAGLITGSGVVRLTAEGRELLVAP